MVRFSGFLVVEAATRQENLIIILKHYTCCSMHCNIVQSSDVATNVATSLPNALLSCS